MKIASWNVNSIRARIPNILEWLEEQKPDIALFQELKAQEENFPYDDIKNAGYNVVISGQKSWNGVAILSKHEITDVITALPGDESDEQARYIEATINGVRVASIYLPNGNPVDTEKYPYKLNWMDRLRTHAEKLLKEHDHVVLGGDYNIIPEDKDCYSPAAWANDALFKIESRQKFRALINLGLTDAFRVFNHDAEQYTFWDYQAGRWHKDEGIRIDHFLLSPMAMDIAANCEIDKTPRGKEKASDHTPIILTLNKAA